MLDAYRDLIDELLGTPAELRSVSDASGDDAAAAALRVEIAALRDRDRAVLQRLQTIIRSESPFLMPIPLPTEPESQDTSILLEAMDIARGDLISLLMNLTLKDWERPAIDEADGEITLADEVERHVEFDEAARRRVRELRSVRP